MAIAWENDFDGADSWNLSAPLTDWDGVVCDEDGERVLALELNDASITGPLPPITGFLGSLTKLDLGNNEITDEIPPELGGLSNLVELNLMDNQLSGSIPQEFSNLLSLQYLAIASNSISGSIPRTIGRLIGLSTMMLQGNQLSGSLPGEFGNLVNLQYMSLSINSFSGSIPRKISLMQSLQHLDAASCGLSGSIPAEITTLVNLEYLDLSQNQLVGVLPPSLTMLEMLSELYLEQNVLTGSIPEVPDSLDELDVSSNYFTSGGCFTDSSINASVSGNCLLSQDCPQEQQQSALACKQFCNTVTPSGACAGQGTCSLDISAGQAVCTCNANYVRSPTNPGTCVPKSAVNSPSPPPAPQPEATSQGLVFKDTPMKGLNRWSRYLSLGFSTDSNGPSWRVNGFSSWMAPADLFLFATPGAPQPTTGVLSWPSTRDQGACGSCWAMATADAVGASTTISSSQRGGPVVALSADQIVACTNASGGCQGDFPTNALDYAILNRLQTSNSYVASPVCPTRGSLAPQVIMYEAVQFRGWFGLLLTVQRQPAIVILQGSDPSFQQATCNPTGSFGNPDCYTDSLDHAVLVIGYDTTGAFPYWVIRNSWGRAWGCGGVMRMSIQGGVGVCGMNIQPAYYPVSAPPPGDPCYTKSTVPDRSNQPALNPCGGGTCSAFPAWGPYSYTCSCKPGFVAVNNTVTINKTVLPGAGLGITQTCVPVEACTFSEWNPCGVGTCVNDNKGGYSCICPLGYFQDSLAGGSSTCSPGDDPTQTRTSYTVQAGVDCQMIAAAYNVTVPQLKALNKPLDCSRSPLPVGTTVNIGNTNYQCQIPYITGPKDKTCQDVADLLKIKTQILKELNVGSDCTNLRQGQLLCLRRGSWHRPLPCTQFYSASSSNPCAAIEKIHGLLGPSYDRLSFFALNPGITCNPPDVNVNISANAQNLIPVCIKSGSVGVRCPKGYNLRSLLATDTCPALVTACKKTLDKLKQVNKLTTGLTCQTLGKDKQFCC